ncbi:hypothetical protein [Tessaracoccus sp. OH4464_COT-324]|nr:hypothetical protein [Tessaracoccus sp. OH4464_COT-324]
MSETRPFSTPAPARHYPAASAWQAVDGYFTEALVREDVALASAQRRGIP